MDEFSKIEFPLFLTRYLNFSYTDYYDVPLVKKEYLKNIRKGEFGEPSYFLEKIVTVKDENNPNILNLWYLWREQWVNISKLTTEHSLDQDFIKKFNEDIKQLPFYIKE